MTWSLWINNFFYYLLLNSLVGMLTFFVWRFFFYFLRGRLAARTGYRALKLVLALFLCPVTLLLFLRDPARGATVVPFADAITPAIYSVLLILFFFWAAGALLTLAVLLRALIRFRREALSGGARLTDPLCLRVLELVKIRLGIRCGVLLYSCDRLSIPLVCGVLHPAIYLPDRPMDERELTVILTHELMHVKHRDLLCKHLTLLLRVVFWFHPAARSLEATFSGWSEFYCDEAACRAGKGLFTAKEYFVTLLNYSCKEQSAYRLTSSLCEYRDDMENRLASLSRRPASGKKAGLFSAIFSACFLAAGFLLILSANRALNGAYAFWYQSTSEIRQETVQYVNEPENEVSTLLSPYVEAVRETEVPSCGGTQTIQWEVPANSTKKATSVSLLAGQKVSVNLQISPGSSCYTGLLMPLGTTRALTAEDNILHVFTAPSDGDYAFFITNPTGETLTASGAVIFHEASDSIPTSEQPDAEPYHDISESRVMYDYAHPLYTTKEGKQYCLDPDGAVIRDAFVLTVSDGGGPELVRYMNSDGFRQDGWVIHNGGFYYVDPESGLFEGWKEEDGRRYYLGPHRYTGLQKIDGKIYYFSYNGEMRTGWVEACGRTLYFDDTGAMVTGVQTIGGKTYYFNEYGLWA